MLLQRWSNFKNCLSSRKKGFLQKYFGFLSKGIHLFMRSVFLEHSHTVFVLGRTEYYLI